MASSAVLDRSQNGPGAVGAENEALQEVVARAEQAEAEVARLKAERDGGTLRPENAGERDDVEDTDPPHAVGEPQASGEEALRRDPMMARLLDALAEGQDIGHYGRLVFAMVARHFLSDDEVIERLSQDADFGEDAAQQMVRQVEARGYNPPRRERILEWQQEQEFALIPDKGDPDFGNVYKTLRFDRGTYEHIGEYQEEKLAHDEG